MVVNIRRKNTKRPGRIVAIFALAIIFLILSALSVRVYFLFYRSFFKKLERSSFVLLSGKSQVIVFSFQGNEGLILNFQPKDKVKVTRGFGEYELAKVYPLGELDKKGGLLLKETMQEYFKVPIFGYFYDPAGSDYLALSPEKLFLRVFSQSLKRRIKTDLNFSDLLVLILKLRRLSEGTIKVRDFQGDTNEFFKDKGIRTEVYSIEVLNSTEHSGLAQRVSELLENAGGRVVRIAEASENKDKCLLLVNRLPHSNLSQSYTVAWLSFVFDCQVKKETFGSDRADLTLIIGEDYWKKLSEKW